MIATRYFPFSSHPLKFSFISKCKSEFLLPFTKFPFLIPIYVSFLIDLFWESDLSYFFMTYFYYFIFVQHFKWNFSFLSVSLIDSKSWWVPNRLLWKPKLLLGETGTFHQWNVFRMNSLSGVGKNFHSMSFQKFVPSRDICWEIEDIVEEWFWFFYFWLHLSFFFIKTKLDHIDNQARRLDN